MLGPSIEFDNVSLSLGNTPILSGVNFAVRAGTIHCIIGANGGGKTSLLRSLLGQMPHTGQINIQWQRAKGVGYVPQTLEFDQSLPITVNDFLAMTCQRRPVFLGVSSSTRVLIDHALNRVGLATKRLSRLGSLSGGERQRVLFAQAMIPEPSLLVLDEPMTGLDLAGQQIIAQAIREFSAQGGTVIWTNHDITQIIEIADAVTYINRNVLLNGAPREVLTGEAALQLFPTLARASSQV